jgi:cell division septation protein DedD
MAPSDTPNDDDKNGLGLPRDDSPSPDVPLPAPDEYLANMDVPIEDIPELDDSDLRADTLEFERIKRRTKPKRTGLKFILAVLVVVGVGYGAWAQWGIDLFGPNADELPIVRASETPLKVRPEKPGGINIPNLDKLVYDRLEKKPPEGKTENLLPRPEVPLPPPTPKPLEQTEVTVGPEATPEAKPTPPKTVGSQPTTAEVQAVKKPAPAPTPPKIEKKTPAVVAKEVAPKVVAKPAPVLKASTNKNYQIQLAAVRNADTAKKEWARLQNKHASLLGKLSLNVVRADLGKKGIFYRLRAGPFANQTVAKALCQSLAKVKVGCLVIRPGR